MTTVSAIIPTVSGMRALREALAALYAQTRPVHEILVCDDDTVPGLSDALEAARRTAPVTLRPITMGPGGEVAWPAAVNRVRPLARGEALWICSDQERVRPDAALHLVDALEGTGAPVAGARHRRPDDAEEGGGGWPDLDEGVLLRHLLERAFLVPGAILATKAVHERAGPLDEALSEAAADGLVLTLAAGGAVSLVDHTAVELPKGRKRMPAERGAHLSAVHAGLRAHIPLSTYRAMFEASDAALVARAGLLQRGAVAARAGLWTAALEDFDAAAEYHDAGPLNGLEWAICQRAFAGEAGWQGAIQGPAFRGLGHLRYCGPLGLELGMALARGLRWRARTDEAERNTDVQTLLIALAGSRRFDDPDTVPPRRLAERDTLPDEAYVAAAVKADAS